MQTSRCRVVAAMVQSAISVATLTRTSKPNQNQNQCHSGAAAQAAGVESIVIVNQVCIGTNWPWQSNKTFRTYVVATFCTFSASVATIGVQSSGAKEGGSICPAKYTSWPYLAPSSSRSNATVLVAALQQQPHCNRSHSIPVAPRDSCSNRFRDFPCPLAWVGKVPDRVSLLAATCPSAYLFVWQHLLQRILAAFPHQQAPN